jgi:hypothetical protein
VLSLPSAILATVVQEVPSHVSAVAVGGGIGGAGSPTEPPEITASVDVPDKPAAILPKLRVPETLVQHKPSQISVKPTLDPGPLENGEADGIPYPPTHIAAVDVRPHTGAYCLAVTKLLTSVQDVPLKVSVAPSAGPEPATNPAAVVPAPP